MAKTIIFGLLGGLGLFLYGMSLMGEGLQKAAGDRLRGILEILTGNTFSAILVGAGVSAIIQSSSATTVMVVSFVNAGLMTLKQAIGVIMGANIGTTITAWLIAIDLGEWALPAIGLGFLSIMLAKNKTYRYIGQTILGFGLLFLGIEVMSTALSVLKQNPKLAELFISIDASPIKGLFLGIVVTMLIQSSSATTGLVIALGSQGLLSFGAGLPLILGANIGTCITAILASIGSTRTAKKASAAHLLFNVVGSVLAMILLPWFTRLVFFVSTKDDFAHLIANAHTAFNVLNTLLWIGFVPVMEKMVNHLVPGHDSVLPQKAPEYLDKRMLTTPSVALSLASRELLRMAKIASEMIEDSKLAFFEHSKKAIEDTLAKEDVVDHIQKELISYLSAILSRASLTKQQSAKMAGLMNIVSDVERVADHCTNLARYSENVMEENVNFSDDARDGLLNFYNKVQSQFDRSVEALRKDDRVLAREVMQFENEIDTLETTLRRAHLKRINCGECSPFTGIVFVEVLRNLERIGDHSVNIVEPVLDEEIKIGRIDL
ncbi:MAG: Na/Pi cotransporter family protein [Firmicutes bacterium]|nr:Na/Pi cotransporter family protein [Bacillota bacterium]MDD4263102.1 Na/Pi cotransporter family protein [Bacillota bacterium]MDD4693425.1 Na/Pi cotransporter family protein [Bacillota bacterium]